MYSVNFVRINRCTMIIAFTYMRKAEIQQIFDGVRANYDEFKDTTVNGESVSTLETKYITNYNTSTLMWEDVNAEVDADKAGPLAVIIAETPYNAMSPMIREAVQTEMNKIIKGKQENAPIEEESNL